MEYDQQYVVSYCDFLFPYGDHSGYRLSHRHRLQWKTLISDPGMHHGTCITHVQWFMSGLLSRGGEENVPGIPGVCAAHKFTYLVRAPCVYHSNLFPWYRTGMTQHLTKPPIRSGLFYLHGSFVFLTSTILLLNFNGKPTLKARMKADLAKYLSSKKIRRAKLRGHYVASYLTYVALNISWDFMSIYGSSKISYNHNVKIQQTHWPWYFSRTDFCYI